MITIEQAKQLTYRQELYHRWHRNADGTPQRWRVNGQIKLWKTRPEEFRVPLKYGLYGYDYLDKYTAADLCLTEEEALGLLTPETAHPGLLVECIDHPEWGRWRLEHEDGRWTIYGRRGPKVLHEGEFHFWRIVGRS